LHNQLIVDFPNLIINQQKPPKREARQRISYSDVERAGNLSKQCRGLELAQSIFVELPRKSLEWGCRNKKKIKLKVLIRSSDPPPPPFIIDCSAKSNEINRYWSVEMKKGNQPSESLSAV
jgi:hypothetical protein